MVWSGRANSLGFEVFANTVIFEFGYNVNWLDVIGAAGVGRVKWAVCVFDNCKCQVFRQFFYISGPNKFAGVPNVILVNLK
jgi:hypothetical protein